MGHEIPQNVLSTIYSIYGVLVIASGVGVVLPRIKPGSDFMELRQRIRTWWLLVILFTGALILSPQIALLLFAFVSFLAFKEFLSFIPTRRADRRVLFWAYLSIPFQYYWVHIEWYGMFIVFIPVYVFLLLPMRMVMIGKTEGFLRAAGTIHWGLMTTVFCISHAAYLLVLRLPDDPERVVGPGLLLALVLLTQANDIAQYVFGKLLGKRKITPTVSPNKTWAGFVGGMATTIALAAWLGPWLTPMDMRMSLWAGAIIGLGGFIGDVVVSAIKRDIGIKDTGTMLPGHGGVIDRIDSLTFTAPLFFHYVGYFYF